MSTIVVKWLLNSFNTTKTLLIYTTQKQTFGLRNIKFSVKQTLKGNLRSVLLDKNTK